MKKTIAYIAMAAVIATLFCACGDGRIDNTPVTSPLLSPDVNTEVTPNTNTNPNVSPDVSAQVSPYVSMNPDDGIVEDSNGIIGDENNRDDHLNTPAVTPIP